jgi:hypothetical protein
MSMVKVSRLPADEIIARYIGGEGRGVIGLRAGLTDTRIKEILLAAGVPLRDQAAATEIRMAGRRETMARSRRRRRC